MTSLGLTPEEPPPPEDDPPLDLPRSAHSMRMEWIPPPNDNDDDDGDGDDDDAPPAAADGGGGFLPALVSKVEGRR